MATTMISNEVVCVCVEEKDLQRRRGSLLIRAARTPWNIKVGKAKVARALFNGTRMQGINVLWGKPPNPQEA